MASPSTSRARIDLQSENENERLDTGTGTEESPHTDKSLGDSPYMDEGPNDSTHLDGGVNEPPHTHHDDAEDPPRFKIAWEGSYWREKYAEHVWNDGRGWHVLNPGSPPEPWWVEDPPPRSPSDPDYLCDVCSHINLRWIFRNNMSRPRFYRERAIAIGTVGQVLKQANCSFCVLLASRFSSRTLDNESERILIESKSFSEDGIADYNHPETEVKYLSILVRYQSFDIQLLDTRPMRGRQISPYITEQSIARQWLEDCEHKHCDGGNEVMVSNLALIDLKHRCIVRPHGSVRYAALSYVWGKTPQRMYSTNTRQEFETKGILHPSKGFLPQTIADAMDLAAHIGLDYLWVDSLCILQDDPADKDHFISRMGTIYGSSAITIVDANGNDARSGLVGMSSPRTNFQRIAAVQGMRLCTTAGSFKFPFDEFHTCAWLKRGWTYQEMLLSKRLLLVTHHQLQFVCNHAVYFEETHPHSPRTSDWTLPADEYTKIRRSEAAGIPILNLYHHAVEEFTSRSFTYDKDVIPAFQAIFKAVYKSTDAKSVFNLPDIDFEEALLWESKGSEFNHVDLPPFSREARSRCPDRLPTWTWAGWKGQIWYGRMRDTLLISAVSWLCAPTSSINEHSIFTFQDYRCRAWKEEGWKHQFLPEWDSHVYTHHSRPDVFFRNPVALKPHDEHHKPSFVDDSGFLHFLAFTVDISTSIIIHGLHLDDCGAYETNWRDVLDSSKYVAGWIVLDYLPADEADLHLVALARCSEAGIQECERQLGIDLRNIAPLDWDPEYFKNISQPNTIVEPKRPYGGYGIFNAVRFQDKFYPLYATLLVEMREGIAYRVGIGRVHIDAFHAANPIRGEVRLG